MITAVICILYIVPALAYQEYSQNVLSWNSTEIEFRIPRNYPNNIPIFSIQVLQLPNYPIGSDIAQVACKRPTRYSGARKSNPRYKRDIKENKNERRRRGERKDSFMGIIDSVMRTNPMTRNVRRRDEIADEEIIDAWSDITKRANSESNIYRSRSWFKLLNNQNKLFKLLYNNNKSLLSLALQKPLIPEDYVHANGNYVEVTLAMDDCDKRKKIVELHYIKLQITEPFDCNHPAEKMCMLPIGGLYLRQWENRKASPLLVLPSLRQFCPELRRRITVTMTDLGPGIEPEVDFNHKEDAFYNNITLDRELRDSKLDFSLSCLIQGQKDYLKSHMTSSGELFIEDENDSPPVASRDRYVIWEYSKFPEGSKIHKNHTAELKNKLFVVDADLTENNDFSLSIEGFDFKDDAVERSIMEFSVPKENCFSETRSLASPLKARCTIIIPDLIFNESISHLNQSSINFALIFRDNSLLNSKSSGEVSYNITILLNETNYSNTKTFESNVYDEQIDTNITVSRPAQKYSRLGKIGRFMPFDISGSSPSTKFELAEENRNQGLDITPFEGILYISNPSRLEDALDKEESLEITVKIESKMVKKLFLAWSEETCPRKNTGSCAKHLYEDDCLESCGLGSRHKCQWRQLKGRFKTTHYATCSPEVGLCPDGSCDEHENLDEKICPQDCMDAEKIKNKDIPLRLNENISPQRGIIQGFGVCSCDAFCQCFPVHENKSIQRGPKNPRRTTIADDYATSYCDLSCQIGISCFIIFCFIVGIIVYRKRKHCNGKYKGDNGRSGSHIDYFDDYSSSYASGPAHGEAHVMALHAVRNNSPRQNNNNQDLLSDIPLANFAIDKKWEFPRNQLVVEKTLGEGEFGRVMKAKAYEINSTAGCSIVAVKMLKNNSTQAELVDLLSEFDLLKEVSHPNVIRLLGACTAKGGPVYLIMEFCKYGSLRTYLRRSRHFELESRVGAAAIEEPGIDYHVTPKEILSFLWQICKGMTYLTNMKLVHRDLAARNILLAEDKICKISDFGLTRDIYEGDLYFKRSKGRVPVKWMAPESLADHVYTHKSDIWSFGVLLWELATLGSSPYPGVTPERLFTLLKSGYRMEKPENCSFELYQVMKECWAEDQERRPTFSQLTQTFEHMIQTDVEYLELRSLIVTNRMYFDNDTNKSEFQENKLFHRTGSSLDDLRSSDREGYLITDNDSYLLAKPVNATATFPPTPLNPRIHAHNPAYLPVEVNSMLIPAPLQYSTILSVEDEEEDAKTELEEQQSFTQCEWDSDSGRATGDSGYITEDNKKIFGSRNGFVPRTFSASPNPLIKSNNTSSPTFSFETTEKLVQQPEDLLNNGALTHQTFPKSSECRESNRISLESSPFRDGTIASDSITNTPKTIKRSPIIV